MTKIYLIAFMLILAGSVFAQQKNKLENPNAVSEKTVTFNVKKSPSLSSLNKNPDDVVFTEDFANGLDGNNELGLPWTTAGPNADLWRHDFIGPVDQWSVDVGTDIPLESTTADNGFMLFAPADHNEPIWNETQTWETITGWMQSPSMDLSDLNSVLVDFEIYYRYCCYSPSPIHIGVSIDGGSTWTNFRAYNYSQYIEIAKEFSGTLQVTADLSSVAANQNDVIIRFSYNDPPSTIGDPSYGFYFVGIDDVAVYENPNANNLAVLQVMNGNVDSLWELKNYPLEQSAEIYLGAVYGNYGSVLQTGVNITWDIMSGENILHTSSVDLGDVPTSRLDENGTTVQNIDTAWINSGFSINAIGSYTIKTTITANEEEEVIDNAVLDRYIRVTTDLMSHDDLNLLDKQIGPRDAAGETFLFEEIGFGTRFFVYNPGSMAYGVQVVFGDNSTLGMEAFIEFYEVPDTVNGINVPGFENMPTEFSLTEAFHDVSADDFGVPVFILFDEPIELEVGKTYLASVRQFEGDEELWVMGTNATDTDNSSYVREKSGGGDYVWFSRATELSVRLGFSETTAVNEITKQDLKLSVAPNPASEFTNVSYELKENKKVSYKMYDANGRIIISEGLGTQTSGEQHININTSNYKSGIYYIILTIGESIVSEKIVIAN